MGSIAFITMLSMFAWLALSLIRYIAIVTILGPVTLRRNRICLELVLFCMTLAVITQC